jgi:phosphatidylserine/phosphatidylglycerophosphate/cardiolipin synthase-like enzyme
LNIIRVSSVLADLAENLTDFQSEELIGFLESQTLEQTTYSGPIETTSIRGKNLEHVRWLIREWSGDSASLAASLRGVREFRQRVAANKEIVDLVWTGPVQFSVPARSTIAVTKEIIRGATQNVTIVGYLITPGAKSVFETLAQRMRDGLHTKLVLDDASKQFEVLRQIWPGGASLPEIYEDKDQSVHAKLVVADSKDALVTSANLTYYGLRTNLEIGLRVRGKTAFQIESLIHALIEGKRLTKFET